MKKSTAQFLAIVSNYSPPLSGRDISDCLARAWNTLARTDPTEFDEMVDALERGSADIGWGCGGKWDNALPGFLHAEHIAPTGPWGKMMRYAMNCLRKKLKLGGIELPRPTYPKVIQGADPAEEYKLIIAVGLESMEAGELYAGVNQSLLGMGFDDILQLLGSSGQLLEFTKGGQHFSFPVPWTQCTRKTNRFYLKIPVEGETTAISHEPGTIGTIVNNGDGTFSGFEEWTFVDQVNPTWPIEWDDRFIFVKLNHSQSFPGGFVLYSGLEPFGDGNEFPWQLPGNTPVLNPL